MSGLMTVVKWMYNSIDLAHGTFLSDIPACNYMNGKYLQQQKEKKTLQKGFPSCSGKELWY